MVFVHLFLFILSAAVIWGLSGLLVSATERVAKHYNRPGFAVAFFVLGLITSISEFSVATNATIKGVPQIAAGNLVGGSVVIFLLLIPLLAVLGGGVAMTNAMAKDHLALLLLVVALPVVSVLDGEITRGEGILILLLYIALLYAVQKRQPVTEVIEETVVDVEEELLHTRGLFHKRKATLIDFGKIIGSGICIFFAGKILVGESLYFSEILSIPPSLVGLLILSLGTNTPEIVIAVRCIVGRHKDIAFGDYMGSAAANSLLMVFLVLSNGRFTLERSEFIPIFFLFVPGLILFYVFSRTKEDISRREGMVLLSLYVLFLFTQIGNVIRFAGG